MTHEERRRRIEQLYDELRRLESECVHEAEEGVCKGCGEDFGWECPDSPDRVCHYHAVDGKVRLIDGREVDAPGDCSIYCCMFCGCPEERK